MNLSHLVESLDEKKIIDQKGNLAKIEITQITSDTLKIKTGSLFVAIKGFSRDGHQFVKKAVEMGAIAIVVEREQPVSSSVVQIVVSDSREALAYISSAFYQHPSKALTLIGLTGTNGKTTSSYILESIFISAGFFPGVIGTVNYRYGKNIVAASHTTPESSDFQSILATMKQKKVTHVISEVSSHGLKLKRAENMHFDIGVFTNLTQDHLDFHADFEDYYQSKKRLFNPLLIQSEKKLKKAVINLDDSHGKRLYSEIHKKVDSLTFSLENSEADIYAKNTVFDLKGVKSEVVTPSYSIVIESYLLGHHNLSNILAVVAISYGLGISKEFIQKGVAALKNVPGRLEKVEQGQDFLVVVDYAHTDDALKNVGKSLALLKKKKIITVFGCGGDRDRKKRPLMAKAVESFSDVIIVTSDNPRTEDPSKIIEDIKKGFSVQKKNITFEVDRKKAIHQALKLAQFGDIVLIAGKGHEDYQILGTKKVHFDDREIAKEVLCLIQKK